MASQRRVIPIVALVAVLGALVVLRLVNGDAGDGAADGSDGTDRSAESDNTRDGTQFVDVTAAAGLDEPHSQTELTGESAMTAGAAVADIDGDSDLDLYLTRVGLPDRLMRNEGDGTFADVTDAAGLAADRSGNEGSSAALFADLDTDGLPDLVVTGAGSGGLTLFRNQGDGTFVDRTEATGLDLLPAPPDGRLSHLHGLTSADYDRDGDLDLLVTHWDETIPAALADPAANEIQPDEDGGLVCPRARWLAERGFPRAEGAPGNRGLLLRNDGAGRFDDVTAAVGLPFDEVLGFTGSFVDMDGDGWEDLALTGDFCTSRLFRNVGGTRFEDITRQAGVGTDENGMGSVITDLDGDGRPDWFVTSIGPVGDDPAPLQLGGGFGSSGNRAYLNRGDGTFRDATDELGLRNGGWGWGAAVEDFTNEGRRSVVMTNGYSIGPDDAAPSATDPLVFWQRADSEGPFRDVAADLGLTDRALGRGLVPFDMDRDGDLDLLVANFGAPPVLYRNDTPPRRWLTVTLDDLTAPANRLGIGARIVVTPEGGEPTTGWIIGGGSYESQVPTEVHVGLGDAERARVEVHWPGGGEPQVLDDVAADQVLTVQRTG